MLDPAQLRRSFRGLFGGSPHVFRAPGRVNLIGEHTDYNDGWVLPIAIDRACYVLAQARTDNRLRIRSEQMHVAQPPSAVPGAHEIIDVALDDPRPPGHHWSAYVRGVAWALREAGYPVRGADLLISSDVPLGAGLSSSAALEVATALALLGISDLPMDRTRLALACQRAENEYVGMRCGIMDQLIACFARAGHAALIDCRTLKVEYAPIDESQARIVVANTMVKHALAASEYNRRRAECEDAVRRIREQLATVPHPREPAAAGELGWNVKALRDISWPQIEALVGAEPNSLATGDWRLTTAPGAPPSRPRASGGPRVETENRELRTENFASWPDNVLRRARHVTTENARVHAAVAALRAGDFAEVGRLMYESHHSLDADYAVTSPELNTMVALARELPGCYGARMTGGGFGGCTVNLVRADAAEQFALNLARHYQQSSGIKPEVYAVRASDAAGEICN